MNKGFINYSRGFWEYATPVIQNQIKEYLGDKFKFAIDDTTGMYLATGKHPDFDVDGAHYVLYFVMQNTPYGREPRLSQLRRWDEKLGKYVIVKDYICEPTTFKRSSCSCHAGA